MSPQWPLSLGPYSHSRVGGTESTCALLFVGAETWYTPVTGSEAGDRDPSISGPGEPLAGMGGGGVSSHAPAIGSEASQGSRLQRGGSTLPERFGVQTRWRQKFLPARQLSGWSCLHAHSGPHCTISLPRPLTPHPPGINPRMREARVMTMGATWAELAGAGHVGALFAPGSTFCSGCQAPPRCASRSCVIGKAALGTLSLLLIF